MLLQAAVSLCHKRTYADASSVSDRALFPGYKGEFNTNLEFIFPENTAQIECYRVMNRKGVVLDPTQDPQVQQQYISFILIIQKNKSS